jgi:large subunit ribosomal protein L21
MFAVIKTGGKQYRVAKDDVIVVEKIEGDAGADIAFGDVLMVADGGSISIGAPTISGAKVTGQLIEQRQGEKVKVFKKRRRNTYRRTKGHRQLESVVKITAIVGA